MSQTTTTVCDLCGMDLTGTQDGLQISGVDSNGQYKVLNAGDSCTMGCAAGLRNYIAQTYATNTAPPASTTTTTTTTP